MHKYALNMRAFAPGQSRRAKTTISISRAAAAALGFFPSRRRRMIGRRDDVVVIEQRRTRTKNISFVVVGKAAASWDDDNNDGDEGRRRRGNEVVVEEEDSSNGGASVYSQPEVYAHAFGGFRDFTKEVDALHQLYALEGGKGTKMRTLLELGCGPAWHSIEHAKKVIREKHKEKQERGERRNDVNVNVNVNDDDDDEDVVSVALDVNREMVSFAIERASEAKAGANDTKSILDAVDVVLGDMRDLSTHLPGKYLKKGGYFDCATLLLGTAAHLLTHDDLSRTFREAFKCLRVNGIFVVEVEHPMTTLFSGDLKYQYGEENAWEVRLGGSNNTNTNNNNNSSNSSNSSSNSSSSSGASRSGEDEVEKEETMRIVWGDPENDVFDVTNQILYRTVSVQKYYSTDTLSEDGDDDDDEVGLAATFVRDPHYESKEIVKCKLFTLPELIAVASAVGFRLIDSFGDLDVNVRFDCENAQNMVVAFRKD